MSINNLLNFLAYICCFVLSLIPLVVVNDLFFPFVTGKVLFFRVLVEISFASWFILAVKNPVYRPKISVLVWALIIWTFVTVLSSFFGDDIGRSIYSNFERMEGVITYFHLLAYFIVVSSLINTKKLWSRFLNVSVGVSWVVVLYGIFQLFNVFEIHQGGVRLDATFGNAAYLASYILFHIFIVGFLFLREQDSKGKYFYGVSLISYLFILYNTATRGAILGLIVGLAVTFLLIYLLEKENKGLKRFSGGVILTLILLLGVFVGVRNIDFVKNSPVLGRFASISFSESTTQSRFLIWNMAWEGFKERPILGWGPENFRLVFDKYYDPKMYNQEQWFDRSHNVVFDWLVSGGILGLLSYLSIFIAILYLIWWKGKNFSITEKSLFTGLIAGYFFQNLFVFDNIVTYYLFFTIASFVHFSATTNSETKVLGGEKELPANKVIVVFGVTLLLIVSYFSVLKPYTSASTLIESLRALHSGDIEKSMELYNKSVNSSLTGLSESREQIINSTFQVIANDSFTDNQKLEFTRFAIENTKKYVEDNPQTARSYFFAGNLYRSIGDQEEALRYYNEALIRSPNKQSILFNITGSYLLASDVENALLTMKKAFELEPNYDEARIRYVQLLFMSRRDKEAEELLLSRFGTLSIDNNDLLNLYVKNSRFDLVNEIWAKKLEKDPTNLQSWFSYSGTFLLLGEKNKAIDVLNQSLSVFKNQEDQKNIEEAINAIKSGRAGVNI